MAQCQEKQFSDMNIPDEICCEIFSYLTHDDGKGLISSCHRFNLLTQLPFQFTPLPKLIFLTEGDRPDIVREINDIHRSKFPTI